MNNSSTLVVFTSWPVERILAEGSGDWALKPSHARRCRYILCIRNRANDGAGPEEHGTPFLIGRISTVSSSNIPDRFVVRFGEYALLEPPQGVVWTGARNPVWYVDDLSKLGIDAEKLQWRQAASRTEARSIVTETTGITFDEARVGIALKYGVKPENVEITIRA